MNAVYCCDPGAMQTCQDQLLKSIMKKCAALAMLSSTSCILGRGYKSFFVHALRHLKSMQNQRDPSFFHTNTTALHQGDWLGWKVPASSISLSDAQTSSSKSGGMCLKHSLKCSSSLMQISCLIALVHPSSLGSSTKML